MIGRIVRPHLEEHFEVVGLDVAALESDPSVRTADVADLPQVRGVLHEFGPIGNILHHAGDPRSSADWGSVLRNNIHGTWNVFLAASEIGVDRMVFASSNHVTGYYEGKPPMLHEQQELPSIQVSDPFRPDGPYGISKLTGEAIARYFYDDHHIESVCLRIGSVLADDDPTGSERNLSTWLSHRDLRQLIRKALDAEDRFPGFGIYYGVSANARRFWDISNAMDELGYSPRDDASQVSATGATSG